MITINILFGNIFQHDRARWLLNNKVIYYTAPSYTRDILISPDVTSGTYLLNANYHTHIYIDSYDKYAIYSMLVDFDKITSFSFNYVRD